jgi:CHASE3 domain sensor protein
LVVEELDAIHVYLSQAAASQQGYLLTGDDTYLDPYKEGRIQVYRNIERLRDLTSDNTMDPEAINRLKARITAKLTELTNEIKVRKRGGLLAGVSAVAKGDAGEQSTAAIAVQIGEMRETETKLLSRRLNAADAGARATKTWMFCGNALAILILVVKGAVFRERTDGAVWPSET